MSSPVCCSRSQFGAHAQQSPKNYRIALTSSSIPVAEMRETTVFSSSFSTLLRELRRLGYVEGKNLMVERISGEGRTEHYADLAGEVVRRNPDLIVADRNSLVLAFKAATATIPIIGFTADPIAFGIVPSLARPGGNITGVSVDAGLEVWGKYLELLRELVPRMSTVGFLCSKAVWDGPQAAAIRKSARSAGVSLIGPPLDAPIGEAEYRRVFAAIAQAGADALVVSTQSENGTNVRLIVELAEKGRLPAIYPYRRCVGLGGLMAYAIDGADLARHAAGQIDQILTGTKPGEIPYYQPTTFKLIINLKTAKALGLTIPATLLARADEVIE
jgi:putative tryptophan/tyrosine transport system substrate-binding protein